MAEKDLWRGAFAAYGAAFNQIKKNWEPVVLYLGVYTLATIVSLVSQGETSYLDSNHATYEDLVTFVFLLALPVYGLAIADRRRISVAEFMRFNLGKYLALIVAVLLAVLIVGVSLLLLIVPAIWAIAWVSMASFAVVDKNLGPIHALKESRRLTRAHVSKVWGVIGVSILLSIPTLVFAFIPFIGSVASQFVAVVSCGAFGVLFRWLQHNHASASVSDK